MGRVCSCITTELDTKENGKMTSRMELAPKHGQMGLVTQAAI